MSVPTFAIGTTEVTQAQWQAVMGYNPSNFKNCDDCPVDSVSWDDIQRYLQKLNRQSGKQYRLPSEAEWEYACRAGGTHDYCGGSDLGSVGWYNGNSHSKTHPVGQKQANAFGLYDMSGNVWEWVQDCWNEGYNRAPTNGGAWTSGECGRRVLRGGAWNFIPQSAGLTKRNWYDTAGRYDYNGFRVAVSTARTLP